MEGAGPDLDQVKEVSTCGDTQCKEEPRWPGNGVDIKARTR